MTPLAPHITAFLRERLPLQRGASVHTCTSYAYTFQLLCTSLVWFHSFISPNSTFF